MPIPSGAPTLPNSNDSREVYNTSFVHGTNPVIASAGAPSTLASTADIMLMRKQREERIRRGEDPDAVAKAKVAKHQARKEKIKRLFGMGNRSEKEREQWKSVDVKSTTGTEDSKKLDEGKV